MNLKELASPIRIYWDVNPETEKVGIDCREICGQLVSSRILSLQVTEYAPDLSSCSRTILESLKDTALALSLTAERSALDGAALTLLRGMPLRGLFLSMTSVAGLESAMEIKEQLEGKIPTGVSFAVNRDNYSDLPEVLSFCVNRGMSFLVIPMQRVMDDRDCFFLTEKERESLTARLSGIAVPSRLKIIIHDPFLWRVFYPSVSFPEGGCQAANTMLYISTGADVYPCPVVPISLGNLRTASLGDIISSAQKKEVRRRLSTAPQECSGCETLAQCGGGCRGRALVMSGSLEAADPGAVRIISTFFLLKYNVEYPGKG